MKNTAQVLLTTAVLVIAGCAYASAEENEDMLFSDSADIVLQDSVVNDDVAGELNEKQFSFTQQINTSTVFSKNNGSGFIAGISTKGDNLTNSISSDLSFDYRLGDGFKGFLSLGLSYLPDGKSVTIPVTLPDGTTAAVSSREYTELDIKEYFLDGNWQNKTYFRIGKQNLKWGRSYFWNPTDLINVEKKDFLDMDKARAGAYGLRVHIPKGVERNTYLFVGMQDASTLDEVSLAGKYEFLVDGTEMSVSAWTKKNYNPVYGFDMSSRLFDMDMRGEVSLVNGDNDLSMNYDTLALEKKSGWIPKASVGFTKSFDHREIKDRFSLTGEFYYNGAGYDKNIFKRLGDAGSDFDKGAFLSQVYKPNSNSKYYLAFFSSMGRFIRDDMSLDLNGIVNLVDRSMMLSSGVSYMPPMKNYSLDLRLNTNLGDGLTEATFSGQSYSVSLGTRFSF